MLSFVLACGTERRRTTHAVHCRIIRICPPFLNPRNSDTTDFDSRQNAMHNGPRLLEREGWANVGCLLYCIITRNKGSLIPARDHSFCSSGVEQSWPLQQMAISEAAGPAAKTLFHA